MIITRFAPSPTGYLHIGSARTALFNWLFARHHGGKFLLRIEDTDRNRSNDDAIIAILDGMKWLGLDWDGEVIYQFARAKRHAEIAYQLLAAGKAYYCYTTPEELETLREAAKVEGKIYRYTGIWRDKYPSDAPSGVKPVIRLKAPQDGFTTTHDVVQGDITISNSQLDDMVLLRSDGTPTYMLAVVVDDHDMGITHIVRGDDHLTNASRQTLIYQAMGWDIPIFAHIPLIHGADGAKLSKRHGALGVDAYREMGYLPAAMRNYLLRLGWSHGDDEIISTKQAIEWFNLEHIGKSPSRFDFAKLNNLNGHYIREEKDEILAELIAKGRDVNILTKAMPGLKQRAKTLMELRDNAAFYIKRPPLNEAAKKLLDEKGIKMLAEIADIIEQSEDIESAIKNYSAVNNLKLGEVAGIIRAAITGSNISPSIFEIIGILEKEEILKRLRNLS